MRSLPLSPAERARRATALTVAESTPPRRTAFAVQQPEVYGEVLFEALAGLKEQEVPAAPEQPAPEPWRPDNPVVTITISGPAGSGKSVIAHVIRNALAREGITASGPDGLRSVQWRRALESLSARGLSVVLQRRA